jgi:hypothetical protein
VPELVREVRKDDRRVALLRCYDGDDATIVEYESEPTGKRGTYRFATAPEAFRFVQEALLALQYLGCTVS